MKKYISILKSQKLFSSFSDDEILSILNCLDAKKQHFIKNTVVIDEDNFNHKIAIVLEGELQNIKIDYNGNQTIITTFVEGDMFAEAFVCAEVEKPSVTIVATMDCDILFLDYNRVLSVCKNTCSFHLTLIRNMLKILAEKNLFFNQKLQHITKRTTREKLLSYLDLMSKQCKSKFFEIPYNRQQLADYLSVDRSAMSAELCKLRDEGFLQFKKNSFKLI